jgi:hypothetical protein
VASLFIATLVAGLQAFPNFERKFHGRSVPQRRWIAQLQQECEASVDMQSGDSVTIIGRSRWPVRDP